MKQLLKIKAILLILLAFMSHNNSFGQESDSLKCNISIVREAFQNQNQVSDELMLKFLKTFGKDCKNNIEFSEFSNETLYNVIQKNPEVFANTLENNLNEIDFDEIIFNLENPLHDLINLDLTIQKIADTKINKSLKTKLIIAIYSEYWEDFKNVEKINGETVVFFLPDSTQFDKIVNSENSDGIYEVSSDFGFYAKKILELYKDSTLNINISDKRFFLTNNKFIDKLELESNYGIILVKDGEIRIENGVFTDIGIQQMISEYFKNE